MATLILPNADSRPDEMAIKDEFGETSWRDFNKRVNTQ